MGNIFHNPNLPPQQYGWLYFCHFISDFLVLFTLVYTICVDFSCFSPFLLLLCKCPCLLLFYLAVWKVQILLCILQVVHYSFSKLVLFCWWGVHAKKRMKWLFLQRAYVSGAYAQIRTQQRSKWFGEPIGGSLLDALVGLNPQGLKTVRGALSRSAELQRAAAGCLTHPTGTAVAWIWLEVFTKRLHELLDILVENNI